MSFVTLTQAFSKSHGIGTDRESITINSEDIGKVSDVEPGGVGKTEIIMKDKSRHNVHETRDEVLRMVSDQ